MKRWLRWTQRLLFACGVLALAYCGFVQIDAWTFQRTERRKFEQVSTQRRKAIPHPQTLAGDGLIGLIEIQRLGVCVIVIEGSGRTVLGRAAGHIPGTALPGQPGNVGISAHRDTFFRPLQNIRQNDLITLTTLNDEYRYRVVSTEVVDPHDVAVLKPTASQVLTLVTCYPFYFIGSAPNRFIVHARRVM